MKRLSVYVFIIVIAGAAAAISATVALHRSHVVAGSVNKQTDAAFRDGLFLARLDAEHGRKPHLATGRWSTDADRRSFVSAYLQTYREMQGAASEQLGFSSRLPAQRGSFPFCGEMKRHKGKIFPGVSSSLAPQKQHT
jgi:hypothetical protein